MTDTSKENTVPPEIGSDFGAELPIGGLDGYYDREWLVTECMAWLGLDQPTAEDYVDEDAERALEAVRTTIHA